jgi:hypothetical protein
MVLDIGPRRWMGEPGAAAEVGAEEREHGNLE